MAELTSEQAQMLISGATQANLSVVWSLRKSNQHILQHMTYDPNVKQCMYILIAEWVPQVTVLKHRSQYPFRNTAWWTGRCSGSTQLWGHNDRCSIFC